MLSDEAKLANEVVCYMVMSKKFDSLTPQEIIDTYIQPIFGGETLQEIKDFYEDK